MPNDLTWTRLQNEINVNGAIQLHNDNIIINVSLLTQDSYANLDAVGVIKFIQKLLTFCNQAQNTINQGVTAGSRLAAFPNPSLGVPTKDSDNIIRATSTQTVLTRLTVDTNQVIGSQN